MKLSAVLLAALVLLAACSSGSPGPVLEEFPVRGYVHAGPTCPTVQNPPASGCEDRPVVGARLSIVDASGAPVEDVTTDSEGRFSADLPAGDYTLVPQPVEGLLGTAPAQGFTVPVAGELDVAYDTGIR